MIKTIKKMAITSVFMSMISLIAQADLKEQLSVRDTQSHDFVVEMTTIKSSFKPDEAIKFNIKGNKDFFLYVFAVDEQANLVTMMLPNKLQKNNKYNANIFHRVPNASEMELVSDKPGTEKIIMLASTKYLKWNTNGYLESGKYLNTSHEIFNTQLEALTFRKPNQVTKSHISKDNKKVIVKELLVNISESQTTPFVNNSSLADQVVSTPTQVNIINQDVDDTKIKLQKPMGNKAISFLSLNKNKYKAGEEALVIFGADRSGYVHLLMIDSRRKYKELSVEKTDGNSIFRKKIMIAKPKGNNKLIAAWSHDEKLDFESIPELRKSKGKKTEAFFLVDKYPVSYKILDFRVR